MVGKSPVKECDIEMQRWSFQPFLTLKPQSWRKSSDDMIIIIPTTVMQCVSAFTLLSLTAYIHRYHRPNSCALTLDPTDLLRLFTIMYIYFTCMTNVHVPLLFLSVPLSLLPLFLLLHPSVSSTRASPI